MFDRIKSLFSHDRHEARVVARLEELRKRTPVPVFWLYGKTQSGKTSIIKYLTGAEEAEIGQGFKPCTRYSRLYQFPTPEAPLLTFLDTRGVDEAGYDPAEDLARFDSQAHVVLITVKVLDHALENLLEHLRPIRRARPQRPVVLALTCLHEAYPQRQHPAQWSVVSGQGSEENGRAPTPVDYAPLTEEQYTALSRSIDEQRRRFEGLADFVVPIDLTHAEEGFADPTYGGDRLKQVLVDVLPAAYRQTLLTLDEATRELQDLHARRVLPYIVGYSTLGATAGAIPIPWIDLFILPGIQTRMIYHLARLYGQPLTGRRFLELSSTLGLSVMARQATREVTKFIPYVGSVAGAVLAGASTFALGKAFCYYYRAVHQGHVPKADDLRHYYQEQLALAEKRWSVVGGQWSVKKPEPPPS